MSKLLRANFARLKKSAIFWIGMVYALGIGYIAALSITNQHSHIDDVLFSNCMFMPIVASVFVGLFIGTEYSDGTIRNKLMVGHTRISVYVSNFIVCTAALLIMYITNLAVLVGIGFAFGGSMGTSTGPLFLFGLISMVTLIALSAFFLLISMLVHNKASGCVAAIIISLVFLMSAMVISSRLQEPEYYDEYDVTFMDESGEIQKGYGTKIKNPNYLTGTKREIYKFLYDFLPGCQMLQIARQDPEHPERLPLYSLSIIIVTTACGMFFFQRKNLK